MGKFALVKASWLESFDFLKIDPLKQMLLVSLRTLFSLYRSFFYAWFLPLTLLVGLVLNWQRLLGAFYITVLVRAARPSMTYKRLEYWQQSVFADWVIFFGVLACMYIPRVWSTQEYSSVALNGLWYVYSFMVKILFLTGQTWLPGTELLGELTVFLSPFIVLWILFMLDAKKTVWAYCKAFGRALLMLFYNYPFFLIVYGVTRIIISLGYLASTPLLYAVPHFKVIGWLILLGAVIPYWVCFLTNFYIKRLHEQFHLYYGTP